MLNNVCRASCTLYSVICIIAISFLLYMYGNKISKFVPFFCILFVLRGNKLRRTESYKGRPKKLERLSYALNWLNCKLIWLLESEKNGNNTITKDPTTSQVCCYTILWNLSVFKATIENKTTSVTTHFKSVSSSSKADILNISCKTAGRESYLDNKQAIPVVNFLKCVVTTEVFVFSCCFQDI